MGRAFCIGLLDFYDINPISRIGTSNLKTLEGVEKDILAHYPIFIPKKKEEEKKDIPAPGRGAAIRKTTSLHRPRDKQPLGLASAAAAVASNKENREKNGITVRNSVVSRMSTGTRDGKKLVKTGSQ